MKRRSWHIRVEPVANGFSKMFLEKPNGTRIRVWDFWERPSGELQAVLQGPTGKSIDPYTVNQKCLTTAKAMWIMLTDAVRNGKDAIHSRSDHAAIFQEPRSSS